MIRSVSTTTNDRIYCKILAHNAVHAAFAGFTGITVGLANTHYVYLPIPVIIQAPRKVCVCVGGCGDNPNQRGHWSAGQLSAGQSSRTGHRRRANQGRHGRRGAYGEQGGLWAGCRGLRG